MSSQAYIHHLLPAVGDVLHAVQEGKSPEAVAGLVLANGCALAGAAHGAFLLVDEPAKALRIAAVAGPDWPAEATRIRLPWDGGSAGAAAASGQLRHIRDTQTEPDVHPLFAAARTELAVPVLADGHAWGVFLFDAPAAEAFDEEAVAMMVLLAKLVAEAVAGQHVRLERQQLLQDLAHQRRLAALGEALAGVLHEVNNPLTTVAVLASTIQPQLKRLGPEGAEAARVITAEMARASSIVKGILGYSRHSAGAHQRFDLNEVIDQTVVLKRFQLNLRHVCLETVRSPQPAFVQGHSQQILQVLLNLVGNAEQAIDRERRDGIIRVAVETDHRMACVTVADNGRGIPAESQSRIFEAFFTTKPPSEGSGLGLSVARNIVRDHGGSIELVRSSPAGTVFTLQLPLVEGGPVAIVAPRPESAVVAAASETRAIAGRVLLLDDEPPVREAIRRYLENQGVTMRCADNARVALTMLARDAFDVAIVDAHMPDMDGLEFYDAACRSLAGRRLPRFLLMSGAIRDAELEDFLGRHRLPFLTKPFGFDELRAKLIRLLPAAEEAVAPSGEALELREKIA